jgi:hypothetical protein
LKISSIDQNSYMYIGVCPDRLTQAFGNEMQALKALRQPQGPSSRYH